MDPVERAEIISNFAAEVITREELVQLFETKEKVTAYDGFEPSGFAHLPIAIYRPLLVKELQKAKVDFILLLADSFAWINNKMGGDLEKIRKVGEYFLKVWEKAFEVIGADFGRVKKVWHLSFFEDPEYWKKVLVIAKSHTLRRTRRALTIAGRLGAENQPTAFFFYPSMQCADIFHLNVDIAQLGLDQRKVNMLARDVAEKNYMGEKVFEVLGYTGGVNGKPIAVHHPLLPGLGKPEKILNYDENMEISAKIAFKMSKSKPETSIYVHDSREEIFRKFRKAFCPPKSEIELELNGNKVKFENPVLVYAREIVFRAFGKLEINGQEFSSFEELKQTYDAGKIHPLDLKNAVADAIDRLISPIRDYFEKGAGKRLYEEIKSYEITR